MVMASGPWNFDNLLNLMKPLQQDETPSKVEFLVTPLWVQIYDLPIPAMTKTVGEVVGSKIGKVLVVRTDNAGLGIGSYLRQSESRIQSQQTAANTESTNRC